MSIQVLVCANEMNVGLVTYFRGIQDEPAVYHSHLLQLGLALLSAPGIPLLDNTAGKRLQPVSINDYPSIFKSPPAYFQAGGLDPLRDQALVYDRILREEYGVSTRVDIYSGFGHMFWMNWPDMQMSQKFTDDLIKGMRWLLEQPS